MKQISLGKYISSIYRAQSVILSDLFKDLGFGSSQYIYLVRINDYPGINQKELSELIHIDRANVNRALKKLASLGYIQVSVDDNDGRNKRNHLTPLGAETVIIIKERLKLITSILSKDIDEDEMVIFQKVMEKMEKNIIASVKDIKEHSWQDMI
jgi:DNA-binding MarR family transcriptional regulator